jgi:hypothetical protein
VLLGAPAFAPEVAGSPAADAQLQQARAVRHALAEYEIPTFTVEPGRGLAESLAR